MVECRTPEREVGGSKPTTAVLCPWARHFTSRKYWLITQEAVAPSRHDWKIVDWDVKLQHKQNKTSGYWHFPLQSTGICPALWWQSCLNVKLLLLVWTWNQKLLNYTAMRGWCWGQNLALKPRYVPTILGPMGAGVTNDWSITYTPTLLHNKYVCVINYLGKIWARVNLYSHSQQILWNVALGLIIF